MKFVQTASEMFERELVNKQSSGAATWPTETGKLNRSL